MTIRNVEIHRYRVPFKLPFTTSRGLEHHRQGLIVRIASDDGATGHGEAAALPAFGTGTFEEIEQHLYNLAERVQGLTLDDSLELLDGLNEDPISAPARFAIDTALLDIQSQKADLPLSQYLQPGAVASVPVNATISDTDAQRAATAASYATMAGYTALKVKVGVHRDPTTEVNRIAAIREAVGSGIELRLDANGAWNYEEAIGLAERLLPYDISYLEQPLPASDTSGLAALRQNASIRIAVDEAATTETSIRKLIENDAADVLIIKPGALGGLRIAREMIELIRDAGRTVVVTTSLETGVAITAALHLAATLPHPVPACGLATGTLLETDLLVNSPVISAGQMMVPSRPGLGVELVSSRWDTSADSR